MSRAYIGLGSNEGDRLSLMRRALEMLNREKNITVSTVSPLYETEPVGGPRQGNYLNACAALDTALFPAALLKLMLEVEKSLGRVRKRRWGPRTLDLDLLIYDTLLMNTPTLTLPHPRMTERLFVLAPLSHIAPDLIIPGTDRSVSECISILDPGGVKLFKEDWS